MLRMLDSVTVANLPPGADAYLGYVDGRFANAAEVKAKFPGTRVLTIAVFSVDNAEAADCEPGDMLPSQIGGWVRRQQARGVHRPVVYASASVMPAVLTFLADGGIKRDQVRLWSAHYGHGKHICGPTVHMPSGAVCGFPTADGTQWTNTAPGVGGSEIDESVLLDDFFQTPEAPMAITSADLKAIADAVWAQDGTIKNPNNNPANPTWTGAEIVEDTNQRVRALQVATAAAFGQDDPAELAKAVLAGLDPATIATAIAAALGPVLAEEVVSELGAKLAG